MRRVVAAAVIGVLCAGCTQAPAHRRGQARAPSTEEAVRRPAPVRSRPAPQPVRRPASRPQPAATPSSAGPRLTRPAWLGQRVLPLRPDGFGQVRPTPPALRNRRLPTVDVLAPPRQAAFRAHVRGVPKRVAIRSTWSPGCPVGLHELRYVTLVFWGFDNRPHTGEMLVHRRAAADVVAVFRRLFRARFPIEEMRVVAPAELDAPPTGDGNNTTAFVCRAARGTTSWSQHAYGLAVDINPFHNPYVNVDLVLPELASAYRDRDRRRPGMVVPAGPPEAAFDAIGWGWGGDWTSLKDWMHFSATGR